MAIHTDEIYEQIKRLGILRKIESRVYSENSPISLNNVKIQIAECQAKLKQHYLDIKFSLTNDILDKTTVILYCSLLSQIHAAIYHL